ncbi:MAG: hypothetical protein FJW27_02940 [Acidimicrobiia bacterium]|nr:hypothetical protein [Acidimicrobiia bacterium]
MAFFQDFADAVESYIRDSVSLDIVDVDVPGQVLNVNDVATFKARVQNNGNLKMTDVKLEIEGLNGALVGESDTGPWEPSLTVDCPNVPKGAAKDTVTLYFKAPGVAKPAFTTIVNVHVKSYNGSLDPLLITQTREEPGKFGHYLSAVVLS